MNETKNTNFTTKNDISNKEHIQNILNVRKDSFINEYVYFNNIDYSTACEVKIDKEYKEGELNIKNFDLKVTQSTEKESNITNKKDTNEIKSRLIIPKELNEDISHPLFHVNFNDVTCKLLVNSRKRKFKLIILGDCKDQKLYRYKIVKFKIYTINQELFCTIGDLINKAILLSEGNKKNLLKVSLRKEFLENYYIDLRILNNKINTCDILLFRGLQNNSICQRLITGADYDHVGILIRNKNNAISIYEATGNDGVKLKLWFQYYYNLWYLLYEKIVYRRLLCTKEAMENYVNKYSNLIENEEEFKKSSIKDKMYSILNKKMIEYLKKTEGKKYTLKGCNFLCGKESKKPEEREGYFCSQLVAGGYQYCGLISNNVDAGHYLPGTFSRDGNIPFIDGFYLSQEYIINFDN